MDDYFMKKEDIAARKLDGDLDDYWNKKDDEKTADAPEDEVADEGEEEGGEDVEAEGEEEGGEEAEAEEAEEEEA